MLVIVLFCHSNFVLVILWPLYHNLASHDTGSLSLSHTAYHDSKNLAFLYNTHSFFFCKDQQQYKWYLITQTKRGTGWQPDIHHPSPLHCLSSLIVCFIFWSPPLSSLLSPHLAISHIPVSDDGQYLLFKANKLIQQDLASHCEIQLRIRTSFQNYMRWYTRYKLTTPFHIWRIWHVHENVLDIGWEENFPNTYRETYHFMGRGGCIDLIRSIFWALYHC